MALIERVILIIIDGFGVGELPDASRYGDQGSDTMGHIAAQVGLKIPHLQKMGIGNIKKIEGLTPAKNPLASFGMMAERSVGKDTTSGHWELMGVVLDRPFPTYPEGFPPEIILTFEKAIGRKILWNRPASGTEIIKKLGQEHLRTGCPIVYTSADSVFQIAAHKDVIPLKELYEMCLLARRLLVGKHRVARVIARPFIGQLGNFTRTPERRDFSLPPPEETLLDKLSQAGLQVTGIGKVEDIFAGSGLTRVIHTRNNQEGMQQTIQQVKKGGNGLIFTTLTDFDALYGHRNNAPGYAKALEEFDSVLPGLEEAKHSGDMLIITSDHGCDPTTPSTDHSREYVPLLVWGEKLKGGVNLGVRASFADVGKTIAEIFEIEGLPHGESFLDEITC
ncbi:phosphopentomutase [bacterium (candidate division B38) B3_B38]|nr:MAG: phosphopentomutase [bacterium (candidate division B38) B3_B38]